MDSAPVQSAALGQTAVNTGAVESEFALQLSAALWVESQAETFELARGEFAQALFAVGAKANYGLPPGESAGRAQMESF